MEYMLWCLGHNFTVAGAMATQYWLGRAHRDFEDLRGDKTVKRSHTWG